MSEIEKLQNQHYGVATDGKRLPKERIPHYNMLVEKRKLAAEKAKQETEGSGVKELKDFNLAELKAKAKELEIADDAVKAAKTKAKILALIEEKLATAPAKEEKTAEAPATETSTDPETPAFTDEKVKGLFDAFAAKPENKDASFDDNVRAFAELHKIEEFTDLETDELILALEAELKDNE